MAETSSLLNCRAGNRTGGSNPPASATLANKKNRSLFSGLFFYCSPQHYPGGSPDSLFVHSYRSKFAMVLFVVELRDKPFVAASFTYRTKTANSVF